MKTLATTVALIAIFFTGFSQDEVLRADHQAWDNLLKQNVNVQGNVNYEGFKRDKSSLDNYLMHLKQTPPVKEWTSEETMAYWLNVYNAYVVKTVVENLPLKSINSVKKPFDQKIIEIGEKLYSLNDVEGMLRKMKDPRVHFGMTKGAVSSPKLSQIAFTGDNVDKRLEALAINFLNDRAKNQLATEAIKISELFKIYAKDFPSKGGLIDFLNKYALEDISVKAKISYMEFNWNLNK
jgi:hypothetical protein